MAMEMFPLADAKNRLSELIAHVQAEQSEFTVTRNGRPAAVVVAMDEWEGLQETLAVLSDSAAAASLAQGKDDEERGDVMSIEQAHPEIEAALRNGRAIA